MSRASVLARGRAFFAAGLTDACVIDRQTSSVTDEATGVVTPGWTVIYEGPARVQEIFGFGRETNPSPDQQSLMRYRILQLPVVGSEDVRVADRVRITTCVNDADVVGVTMIVRDQAAKSEATSRRIGVEEVTG